MTRSFTTYWTAQPWEAAAYQLVLHAASNAFISRGVDVGDRLYVLHRWHHEVFLGARLQVARVADKAQAAVALGLQVEEVWDARDHVLAEPGSIQRLDPDRVIPRELLRELMFLRPDGARAGLVFESSGAADRQSIRAVRELTADSAAQLDGLIEGSSGPTADDVMSIKLRRGPCDGTCPVYEVEFWRDGFSTWQGSFFVDPEGHHVGDVDPSLFREAAMFAVKRGYFDWEESLLPLGTDLPDYEITIRTGTRDKSVLQWGMGETSDFKELADLIDTAAARVTWSPIGKEASLN